MRYLTLCALLMVGACTSVSQTTRLSNSLQASQYNNLLSNFSPRPTSIVLEKMSDGQTVLAIQMTQYGNLGYRGELNHQFRMLKSAIPAYLALLDKYDEWRAQAVERGDAITKVIGRAPAWGQVGGGELEFTFHSGNANRHFLSLAPCQIGKCLIEESLVFDSANVGQLRSLLLKWDSGDLSHLNVDSVYK